VGVYKLSVTEELYRAQLEMYGDEEQCRDHFSSVVLVEVLVNDLDERFNIGHFKQPNPAFPEGGEQVAYDEALLSIDGQKTGGQRDASCSRRRQWPAPAGILLALLRRASAASLDIWRVHVSSGSTDAGAFSEPRSIQAD
jgi:hypothetical protein